MAPKTPQHRLTYTERARVYPLTRQDRIEEGPCTKITRCLARSLDLIDPIG
jgi:hypothetical protein